MMNIFIVFTLIVILMISMYKLFQVNRRNDKTVGACSGALFAFIMYYCCVPILVTCFSGVEEKNSYIKTILTAGLEEYILVFIGLIIFLAVFLGTYKRYNKKRSSDKYIFSEAKWVRVAKFVTISTFVVGGGSFLIYILAFGGVSQLLSYAEYLRSFAYSGSSVVSYIASIMVIPARLITVTPVVAITLCGNKTKNHGIYRIIFIVSIIMTIIFNMANAGRTSVILFALIFGIPMMEKVFKHPWRIAIIIGLFSLPILGLLDSFFVYISGMGWSYESVDAISYLPQFAYPFSNVLNMTKIVDLSGFRWGQDFITGVLNIIPGVNFQPSVEPTCYFYGGANWRITGGTPNDIITFGYLEFGFVGIVLMAVLLGIFLGKADRMIKTIDSTYAYRVVTTSIIVNTFAYMINADIISLVRNQFQYTLVMMCILYSCRRNAM